MTDRARYAPGPASGARIEIEKDPAHKNQDKWTLVLVRELRHPPEKVWQALTSVICPALYLQTSAIYQPSDSGCF